MLLFIVLTIAFIFGMSLSAFFAFEAGGYFLLPASAFLALGILPFWMKHGAYIVRGDFAAIREDDEPVPALTIIFLILFFICFGCWRHSSAGLTNYKGHLLNIVEKEDDYASWLVRGTVIEEPRLRGDYLEVLIQPEVIRTYETKRVRNEDTGRMESQMQKSEPSKVTGGLILAQVYDDSEAFSEVAFRQVVELQGSLFEPSVKRNPGALDYRQYLRNRGIFRTIRIVPRRSELRIIDEVAGGAVWYRFALYVKNEVLKVIKQTMPYPESSFLGGVLLGLRGGLDPRVSQEFRMTGVSHVLAVSGLHVTIIAGLLYGIFTIFKVPVKVFAPIIVFSLFTFALIVGWPSSAVRAALMNSLFVLSKAYLKDYGFKLSVIFSLSVAANFILFMNPLQLTEPSFVLSVMAIYSLAMFSEPSGEMLRKMLRGPGLLVATVSFFMFFTAVIVRGSLVVHPYFFPMTFVYIITSAVLANKLAEKSSFQSFAFEMLPNWLQGFLGAQIAIFIAMMGPLSAFYFGQLSLAAPIANLIAIPLIGLIVQIGLIAGLSGAFVPIIGIYIALVLNAANWLGVRFFLGMASFFAAIIPFPRISQPEFSQLAFYYLCLHLYFFWPDIVVWSKAIRASLIEVWKDPDYKASLSMTGGVLVFGLFISIMTVSSGEPRPDMRLTMLDVGYGSCLLIEEGRRTIMIDSALNDVLAGVDRGERVIQPALSSKKIRQLDAVILSSALPERISGLNSVLEHYRVNKIYAPFHIPTDGRTLTFAEYTQKFTLGDRRTEMRIRRGELITTPPSYYWELAFDSFNELIRNVNRYNIQVEQIAAGDLIAFGKIEVLYPKDIGDSFHQIYDGLLLNIKYRDKSFMYLSGNTFPLEDLENIRPHVIFVAQLPYPLDRLEDYVSRSGVHSVAVSYRFPTSSMLDGFHLAGTIRQRSRTYPSVFRDWNVPVYMTNNTGAVQVDCFRDRIEVIPYINE